MSTNYPLNYDQLLQQIPELELQNKSDFNLRTIALIGIKHEYPACCIYEFCKDLSENKYPGKERGNDKIHGHIPCLKCASNI